MIAQWGSSLSVLPVARAQFPAMAEYFKGFFPDWSHSVIPSWASVTENSSISPQWHHTTCEQWGGRPKSNHGQTMADETETENKTNHYYEVGCWDWVALVVLHAKPLLMKKQVATLVCVLTIRIGSRDGQVVIPVRVESNHILG